MSKSDIPFCTHTFNPVTGCPPDQHNEACRERCWAARLARRNLPYIHGGPGVPFSEIVYHPERLEEPLQWRKPRVVFVCSMGDLFHARVPFEFIDKVVSTMMEADKHTFLVFTKRAERMKQYMLYRSRYSPAAKASGKWPPKNVWLFVSCSTQAEVDERVPLLLETPAAHRGVSLEPLLEPVDITDYCHSLDQVIAGCESGPAARRAKCAWFRSIQEQCREAGVPCYVKQVSGEEGEPKVIHFEPTPGDLAWRLP